MLPFIHFTLDKEAAISTKCSATLRFRIGQERKKVHPFQLKTKIYWRYSREALRGRRSPGFHENLVLDTVINQCISCEKKSTLQELLHWFAATFGIEGSTPISFDVDGDASLSISVSRETGGNIPVESAVTSTWGCCSCLEEGPFPSWAWIRASSPSLHD